VFRNKTENLHNFFCRFQSFPGARPHTLHYYYVAYELYLIILPLVTLISRVIYCMFPYIFRLKYFRFCGKFLYLKYWLVKNYFIKLSRRLIVWMWFIILYASMYKFSFFLLFPVFLTFSPHYICLWSCVFEFKLAFLSLDWFFKLRLCLKCMLTFCNYVVMSYITFEVGSAVYSH